MSDVAPAPDEDRLGAPQWRAFDLSGVRSVALGTAAWTVALLATLVLRGRLAESGRDWWTWTCLAGVGLGLIGLEYCRKRRDALEREQLAADGGAATDLAADGEVESRAATDDGPPGPDQVGGDDRSEQA